MTDSKNGVRSPPIEKVRVALIRRVVAWFRPSGLQFEGRHGDASCVLKSVVGGPPPTTNVGAQRPGHASQHVGESAPKEIEGAKNESAFSRN